MLPAIDASNVATIAEIAIESAMGKIRAQAVSEAA